MHVSYVPEADCINFLFILINKQFNLNVIYSDIAFTSTFEKLNWQILQLRALQIQLRAFAAIYYYRSNLCV